MGTPSLDVGESTMPETTDWYGSWFSRKEIFFAEAMAMATVPRLMSNTPSRLCVQKELAVVTW